MHLKVLIGLVLALTCALGASLAGLWKQKGAVKAKEAAREAEEEQVRREACADTRTVRSGKPELALSGDRTGD